MRVVPIQPNVRFGLLSFLRPSFLRSHSLRISKVGFDLPSNFGSLYQVLIVVAKRSAPLLEPLHLKRENLGQNYWQLYLNMEQNSWLLFKVVIVGQNSWVIYRVVNVGQNSWLLYRAQNMGQNSWVIFRVVNVGQNSWLLPRILNVGQNSKLPFGIYPIPKVTFRPTTAFIPQLSKFISNFKLSTSPFTFRYKTLRTAGNKLVVNLAIANFIMHSKSWVLVVNGIAGGPILGELGMIGYRKYLPTPITLMPCICTYFIVISEARYKCSNVD